MAFVVEDGTGKSDANSYVSVADADAWFTYHLYASDWTGETTENKEKALVSATRLMDENIAWESYRTNVDQALQWPQQGAYNTNTRQVIENDAIPVELENATSELALWVLQGNRDTEPTFGIEELKAGSIELVFDKNNNAPTLPAKIFKMVYPIGGQSNVGGMVKVQRT